MWINIAALVPQIVSPPQSTPDTILTFLQYGVLGIVVFALIRGWIWAKPSVDHLLQSIARLTSENAHLREEIVSLRKEIEAADDEIRELRKDLGRLQRRKET